MNNLLRRVGAPCALLFAVVLLVPAPVSATPVMGWGVARGGGTLSPGLTSATTAQSHSFSGTAVGTVAGSPDASVAVMSCSFSGGGTGSIFMGSGTGSVSCSGATVGSITMSCSVSYSYVGTVNTVTGPCQVQTTGAVGASSGPLVFRLVCMGYGTSPPPVTTYSAECAYTLSLA